MTNIAIVTTIIGFLYALYQAIRGSILDNDISHTEKKESLLQTIIDAKNMDIAKDRQDVKEKSDAYENSKRPTDPKSS